MDDLDKLSRFSREFRAYSSFEEAEDADFLYYRQLEPEVRLEIALKIMAPYYEAHPRFERVYRTVSLDECPIRDDWGVGI